jgi:phosphate ABC transporter permease protein PstC
MDSKDRWIARGLLLTSLFSLVALFVITVFIFQEGVPLMVREGIGSFLFRSSWAPLEGDFGMLPMIAGSLAVAVGTLVFAVPLGVGCAVFLSEFASPTLAQIVKPAVEILFAIPSVVYGFIGVIVLVPFVEGVFGGAGAGFCILTASFVLAIMVLPPIVGISMDALKAVPKSYRDGSKALGATDWQTTRMVVLPAARSGIITSVILGMAAALGETMAVIMVVGNAVALPGSPLDSVRTLTSGIALEMGYATGDHRKALFAMGVILFLLIMILNVLARVVTRRRIRA